jgi:uncharacterized protein (TIGR03067 family)
MNVRRCLVAAAMFLAAGAWCQDAATDKKMLEGTWVIVSAELGEKTLTEDFKGLKLVVKGDSYTVTIGKTVDRGTVKIDPAKTPKTMDLVGVEGPNKGKTILAIYEIQADKLKVCYDLAGKDRPTEFKTKKNGLIFLANYQREKQ